MQEFLLCFYTALFTNSLTRIYIALRTDIQYSVPMAETNKTVESDPEPGDSSSSKAAAQNYTSHSKTAYERRREQVRRAQKSVSFGRVFSTMTNCSLIQKA